MKKNRCCGSRIIYMVFLISFLASNLQLGSTPFVQEAAADHRRVIVDKMTEDVTIFEYDCESIDIEYIGRQNLEVVFTLQVKQDLPIDVWFMNKDNYTLFSNGAQQFLYYIDGSEQQVTYTKNIVILEEFDLYKLVMVNNNNQTIEVDVDYEYRTYITISDETSSEDYSIYIYPLLILIIILAVLLIVLSFKVRKYKQVKPDEPETLEDKQGESEVASNISPGFCGYCGKPVDTPYCKYCGRKI